MDNANPTILTASQLPTRQPKTKARKPSGPKAEFDAIIRGAYPSPEASDDEFTVEPIDEQEIYDLISTISDPEHPIPLGQLAVINLPDIHITPAPSVSSDPDTLTRVLVKITPTVSHCSLPTVIGLGVRVRLEQALPPNYRVDIMVKEGTHQQEDQVNKQLGDKERVAAALENDTLRGVVDNMLKTCV